MAWPPSSGSTTYTQRGSAIATLAWGTDGIYSGLIVKSIRSDQMIEEANIMNGSGLTAVMVVLNDGAQIEVTVEDDRSVTFPDPMATVDLLNPRPSGAAGTAITMQVIHNNYNTARKQNGERTLLCKKYTLITPS